MEKTKIIKNITIWEIFTEFFRDFYSILFLIKLLTGLSDEELAIAAFRIGYKSKAVEKIPCTGVVLTIARDLIHLHHGENHLESELGKGSTFSIFLPYHKVKGEKTEEILQAPDYHVN